jgi:hypothetical protein
LPTLIELVRSRLADVNSSWLEEFASAMPTVITDSALERMSKAAGARWAWGSLG